MENLEHYKYYYLYYRYLEKKYFNLSKYIFILHTQIYIILHYNWIEINSNAQLMFQQYYKRKKILSNTIK